jgi:hypothetical protein
MSTTTQPGNRGNGSSALVSGALMLFMIVTAARLLAIDLTLIREAKRLDARAAKIPTYASLVGLRTDGTEWNGNTGKGRQIVLFPVTTPAIDLEFWRRVETLSRDTKPPLEFVGVCAVTAECAAHRQQNVTLLSFMDPYQMHVVAIARRRQVALVYRDRSLRATLPIGSDPLTLSRELTEKVK